MEDMDIIVVILRVTYKYVINAKTMEIYDNKNNGLKL